MSFSAISNHTDTLSSEQAQGCMHRSSSAFSAYTLCNAMWWICDHEVTRSIAYRVQYSSVTQEKAVLSVNLSFFFFHPFHFHNGPALILQTFYTISSLRYVNNLVNSNTLCNLFSANSTALVRCNSWEEAVNYCNPSADLGEQFHCYSAILLNMHLLHKSS